MSLEPMPREQLCRVIEGRGCAGRVPIMLHFWINPGAFTPESAARVCELLSRYPSDALTIGLNMPDMYRAPADDPSYRWSYRDEQPGLAGYDNRGAIDDWDEELPLLMADFPSADYPGLIPDCLPDDGRYRLGLWWGLLFERFWGIRGMEAALTDFHLNPGAVHALFRRLTDFYKRAITRAHGALKLDGVITSDDLGMQSTTFFSTGIFDEFFAPYYRELIDCAHRLNMHFWLHTCGNVDSLMTRFIDLGIDVLHPIQKYAMDEVRAARLYGGKIAIWAGFDVQRTIPFGTPEDVRREVRYLMRTYARPDGRFILTLGNATTGDTPLASLEALFDEAFVGGTEAVRGWQTR